LASEGGMGNNGIVLLDIERDHPRPWHHDPGDSVAP
jgi:hypothetical protein